MSRKVHGRTILNLGKSPYSTEQEKINKAIFKRLNVIKQLVICSLTNRISRIRASVHTAE